MSDQEEPLVPEIIEDIKEITGSKSKLSSDKVSPAKFAKLVNGEYSTIRKCNNILNKADKIMSSDEFLFSLEPKDLIRLVEAVNRMKHSSFGLITKLYEVCTKNEMLRVYFEESKTKDPVQSAKQDAKVAKIISELRIKAKNIEKDKTEDGLDNG